MSNGLGTSYKLVLSVYTTHVQVYQLRIDIDIPVSFLVKPPIYNSICISIK